MNIEIKIVNKIIILFDGGRMVLTGGYNVYLKIDSIVLFDSWEIFVE